MTHYTEAELNAMTTEQLTQIVSGLKLSTNGDRQFLIQNVLLAQRFPAFVSSL